MIVGFDKQEIELLIDDLRCTVKMSKEVGRAQGRGALAQEVIDKLSKLIE